VTQTLMVQLAFGTWVEWVAWSINNNAPAQLQEMLDVLHPEASERHIWFWHLVLQM